MLRKFTSSGMQWPVIVVGLLVLNACICAATIIAASISRQPVEDDYYDRALRWDEIREAERAAPTNEGRAP
ncbi:MAG: hypothetical protein AAGI17_05995 [Planctomycetota bacterium]